ncbi:hypothetical protein P4H39_27310 [Paenibacillus lautus]|uniref:hypothetical protein n=1 Tax=Paenibacillus lautus TaxID=1401 RepID=UPI002DBD6CE6|nr:hypothetical protein [Paenibacillus lautus]MEC0206319.1 hypothetical protein [Paenibacillus lautus]
MKYNKVFYVTIGIVLFFIMVTVLGEIAEGADAGTIQLTIEWLTKYVLPWIFLYWFIKLVQKIK